jgi:release factor glutamine methyltransferase
VTTAQILANARQRLSQAGILEAALDSETLLRHVTGWDRATLLAHPGREVGGEDARRFHSLVDARAERRPLQHLTGVQAFWRHEFRVNADVLIPRPETEVLVEAALDLVRSRAEALVVDVGTGSGCIALSLAAEAALAEVHATDVSHAALLVARDNARRLGLEDRVRFHEGDLLAPVRALVGRVDLLVSNPPYVDARDSASLLPEVRDHEPAVALFPPGGPLALYRRLLPEAARFLRPGGHALVEVGQGQSRDVVGIAEGAGLVVEGVIPDLARIPRAILARLPAGRPPRVGS